MSHVLRELIEAVILALLVLFIIQISVRNFRVEGHSMRPLLDGGEFLIVNKLSYFRLDMERLARLVPFWDVDADGDNQRYLPFSHPPKRGEVIVFQAPLRPDRAFVKRVIGLPGEKIRISDGEVFVNGEALSEPYLAQSNISGTMECIPTLRQFDCTLQEEQYFVLGDNRGSSNDSRDWGPVTLDGIVGKVWFVYWPLPNLPLLGTFVDENN